MIVGVVMTMRMRVVVGMGVATSSVIVMVVVSQMHIEFCAGDASLLPACDVKMITVDFEFVQFLFKACRNHS